MPTKTGLLKIDRLPWGMGPYDVKTDDTRQIPIMDKPHVLMGIMRFPQMRFESSELRASVAARIITAALKYGLHVEVRSRTLKSGDEVWALAVSGGSS